MVKLCFCSVLLLEIPIRDGYLKLHLSLVHHLGPPTPLVPYQNVSVAFVYVGNDLFRRCRNAQTFFMVVLYQAVELDISWVPLHKFARSKKDVVGAGAFDDVFGRLSFWVLYCTSYFQPNTQVLSFDVSGCCERNEIHWYTVAFYEVL